MKEGGESVSRRIQGLIGGAPDRILVPERA